MRLHKPASGVFASFIWPAIGLVLFGFLYLGSLPRGGMLREMHTAGPDGVTAFFLSPEAAVTRINQMLDAHEWTKLARYYDFSQSAVRPDQATSGAYFAGGLAIPPEGPRERPFSPGWQFLYAEPTTTEGLARIVVARPGAAGPQPSETQSFLMERFPEGYRILPADAAARLPAGPSAP